MNFKPTPHMVEINDSRWMPPGSLIAAIQKHVDEKVTKRECECCGVDFWIPLSSTSDANNFITILSQFATKKDASPSSWALSGYACGNCHFVRWFAVQPIISAWLAAGGKWDETK